MSYRAYITRNFSDPFLRFENPVDNPILLDQWLTVVKNDATLRCVSSENGNVVYWEGFHLPFTLDIETGDIFVSNPSPSVLRKMLEIADQIDAHVRGAEGEYYHSGIEFTWPENGDYS